MDNVGNTEGLELQWEWEGDGGKWTAYAEDLSSILTAAYDNGDDHVRYNAVNQSIFRVLNIFILSLFATCLSRK